MYHVEVKIAVLIVYSNLALGELGLSSRCHLLSFSETDTESTPTRIVNNNVITITGLSRRPEAHAFKKNFAIINIINFYYNATKI